MQMNSTEVANIVTSATDRKLTFATVPTHHEGGPALPERMTYSGIDLGDVGDFAADLWNKACVDIPCIESAVMDGLGDILSSVANGFSDLVEAGLDIKMTDDQRELIANAVGALIGSSKNRPLGIRSISAFYSRH